MKSTGTFHYVVSGSKHIMAVYGHALIEQAFERAAKLRDQGFQCEVYTRSGYRCQVGMLLPESGAVQS
jgi:hypothetical protein